MEDAWFDVKVYMSRQDWENRQPNNYIGGIADHDNAIEEANSWKIAYNAVVVARGEGSEFESGECVYMTNKEVA